MKTPRFWKTRNPIAAALLPFSWLYGLERFYRQRQAKFSLSLSVPVVCVGNVTAGGAGKTPVALHIGKIFCERNIPAYFVSRGYGGTTKGPVLVNPNAHSAREVGDEPLLLSSVLPTIVAKDRKAGAEFAIQNGARAIILDDGFQNASIVKTVSLLVVDGTYGFGNGWGLPAGPLRETPQAAFARAGAVICIGNPIAIGAAPEMPILRATMVPSAETLTLKGQKVFAFCGIGNPQKFFSMLEEIGVDLVGRESFPDHYHYTARDMERMHMQAQKQGALLVTTAKDACRLSLEWESRVRVAEISLQFKNPDKLLHLLRPALDQKW